MLSYPADPFTIDVFSPVQVNFGEMGGSVEDVISLDDGYRLLLLPSGCWCCLPERLEPEISSSTSDQVAEPVATSQGAAPASDQEKLEAMMSGFNFTEDIVGVKSFTSEFGCYLTDNVRRRMVRLYNTDGTMLTTTTVDEKRTTDTSSGSDKPGSRGAMYDEFAD